MLRNLLLWACVIAGVATSWAGSQQGAADKELPFLGPAPPEELQVLAPLVGQWSSKMEARPSLQNKGGYVATGEFTGQWFHNRHFIRLEGKAAGKKYKEEFTLLYSYDAKKKAYRRWLFTSAGLAAESEGQWNKDTSTMTWKPLKLPENITGTIIDVVTKDRFESTIRLKRDDGEAAVDTTVSAVRKK